ncbi:MAG: glycosyltransferase family 2 protein [Rikenellaceae bacterium]
MTRDITLSFIIVNYNGLKDSCELIESIKKFLDDCFDYEIVLVDNGSLINEAEEVRKKFPDVIVVRSNVNMGFAAGNNLGIWHSSGRYIFLINNDALLIDDSVLKMVSFMDNYEKAGAVSPKIYYPGEQKIIQYAGFTKFSHVTLRNRSIGRGEVDKGQYDKECITFSLHGAAMMVRRKVLEEIGFMYEKYFLYYEEIEWCMKIKKRGYELWYLPSARLVHKESRSTGDNSYVKRYYLTRNRLLFARRNLSRPESICSIIYQIFVANPRAVIISLFEGRVDLAKATFKGVIDYLKMRDKLFGAK